MTTCIEKILLPKNKLLILDSIEKNANKIVWDYKHTALCDVCTMTLSTPTINLISRHEIRPSAKNDYTMFSFEQFAESGRILSMQTKEQTAFANKVFDKMLLAYISEQTQNKR